MCKIQDNTDEAWHTLDMGNKCPDHVPLAATITCNVSVNKAPMKRRTAKYDRFAFQDPENVSFLKTVVSNAPNIAYWVEPISH